MFLGLLELIFALMIKFLSWMEGPNIYDESRLYLLPYKGKLYCAQGYDGDFSHQGLYALDFLMKEGTSILAARAGVVVDVKEDSSENCMALLQECHEEDGSENCWDLTLECYAKMNYVKVEHEDGSVAQYSHLQQNGACVSLGQTVNQGDVIALSGNTGISTQPHLDFEIWKNTTTVEPTFADVKDSGIPEAGRFYASSNIVGFDYCSV